MSGKTPDMDGRRVTFPMNAGDVYACCWHRHGWECAAENSVQPAWDRTRNQARRNFADVDYWYRDVQAWKRHIRVLDRQEKYEYWVETQDGDWDDHAAVVPDDWEHDLWSEDIPHWKIVRADDPLATPVWICGEAKLGPPHPAPAKAVA